MIQKLGVIWWLFAIAGCVAFGFFYIGIWLSPMETYLKMFSFGIAGFFQIICYGVSLMSDEEFKKES